MNVGLLSLDLGSSLAANLPRHNSRPGEGGCRHQSSCHPLKGRAPHLHQPRRKGVSRRAKKIKIPWIAEKAIFLELSQIEIH